MPHGFAALAFIDQQQLSCNNEPGCSVGCERGSGQGRCSMTMLSSGRDVGPMVSVYWTRSVSS